MPIKALPLPKEEVTEADFLAALREYDEKVAVIQKQMAERDKRWARMRKTSQARMERIEKMLCKLERQPC
jgi:hypothetical protein